MRILANFSKKVSTATYENETYTVTFEAETEFNNIVEVADYLFAQAKQTVEKQIVSKTITEPTKPILVIPDVKLTDETLKLTEVKKETDKSNSNVQTANFTTHFQCVPEIPNPAPATNEQLPTNPSTLNSKLSTTSMPYLTITDKQLKILFQLLTDLHIAKDKQTDFIKSEVKKLTVNPVVHLKDIPRKTASRLIENLLDKTRKVA